MGKLMGKLRGALGGRGDLSGDLRGASGGSSRFDPRSPLPGRGRGVVVPQAAMVEAHAVPNGQEPLWDRVEAGARGPVESSPHLSPWWFH